MAPLCFFFCGGFLMGKKNIKLCRRPSNEHSNKFGSNCNFRVEYKMFSDDKDGHQVMAIPCTTNWAMYQHSNSLLKVLFVFLFSLKFLCFMPSDFV